MIELGEKPPHLAALIVGNDGASLTYVGNKVKSCKQVGFNSTLITLPHDISENELLCEVDKLNKQNFKELYKEMDGVNGEASTQVETILISKSIERIADHAKNLAEEVIYLLTGK